MKNQKDLYRRLRTLSCEDLWENEVARFDQASPRERDEQVAVIRAVGVVFSASGRTAQKAAARAWLARLVHDPSERVRRYAMAALPKLGAGPREESELLAVLKATPLDRERAYLGRALSKVGGQATLEAVAGTPGLLSRTEQKVRASLARRKQPSTVRLDRQLVPLPGLQVHLRCRRGLEGIVRDEVAARLGPARRVRITQVERGLVTLVPTGPLSLAELFALRCFGTLTFPLGRIRSGTPDATSLALASFMTSPLSRHILTTLTEGALRYRIDCASSTLPRAAVQPLADRAFTLDPDILNDPRAAPWSMDIRRDGDELSVELRPKLVPDPRFAYRQDDVDAASHPPLAACMARLAGHVPDEVVWDPFCGSGTELVECALLYPVAQVIGTDIRAEALAIARTNLAAAQMEGLCQTMLCGDFRALLGTSESLRPGRVTLVISNPPMGRRLRVPDMRGLYRDFFEAAATALRPGGRLVFPNPLRLEPRDPSLSLQFRKVIDLGGFDCRLEKYLKVS